MSTKQNDKAQTNPLTKLLPLPLFMLSLAACVDAPAPRRGQSGNLTTQSLMDPTRASAKVSAATKRFEGLKGDVPVVTIAFGGADSAEVWRCRASFEFV
ncbi:MAG: hypothetical protein RL189_993, partial [Pseudomonadota bacterium]